MMERGLGWLRHPAARRAFYAWWIGRALLALLVVLPVAQQLSAAVAGFPDGDAVLFAPGGVLLVETLRVRAGALLTAVSSRTLSICCVLAAAWLLTSGLLVAMSGPARVGSARWLARGLRWLPAHAALTLAAWALRAALLVIGALLVVSLDRVLGGALEERTRYGLLAATGGLAALPVLAVQVWADLARAGLRRASSPVRRSALLALEITARQPAGSFLAYLALMAAAYAGMALGALIARATATPPLAALAQQLGFVWLCGCRASWLWRCVRLSQATERRLP